MDPYQPSVPDEVVQAEDEPLQYFCKLTFGQFFTLVVLLIMTLCFSFYLGARYGNQYLRIGERMTPQMAVSPSMQPEVKAGPLPEVVDEDAKLKELAREALMSQQRVRLEGQMEQMLAQPAQQPASPTTPAQSVDAEQMAPQQPVQQPIDNQPHSGGEGGTQQALPVGGATRAPLVEVAQPPPEAGPPLAEAQPVSQGVVKVKSAGGMQYSVQVGAYQEQREASYYVEEWKTKGYPAYMMVADLGEKGTWYRVRLGGFPTKEDAEKYLSDVKAKEPVNGIVVLNEQ